MSYSIRYYVNILEYILWFTVALNNISRIVIYIRLALYFPLVAIIKKK